MMMSAHMNTPSTKLDIAAESIDEDIISILSGIVLASSG
jgi:hypothetical protein